MLKNSQNFSMQEALRLANSDAGQRLLAKVKSSGGPALEEAMASGDPEAMVRALSPLLASPEIRELLKQLEDRHG